MLAAAVQGALPGLFGWTHPMGQAWGGRVRAGHLAVLAGLHAQCACAPHMPIVMQVCVAQMCACGPAHMRTAYTAGAHAAQYHTAGSCSMNAFEVT